MSIQTKDISHLKHVCSGLESFYGLNTNEVC